MAPITTPHEQELYNSRIVDTYVRLVKTGYSHIPLGELLDYAGIRDYEVADQGHWFSQEQVDRFHDRLVLLSGNGAIAREAGRYAASPEALGVMRQYALGLVDPANVFARIERAAANFTRSASYSSRKLSSSRVEVTVAPAQGAHEKPYQCENRIGFFEALVMMLTGKLPRVTHTECMFQGGSVCRYEIAWDRPVSSVLAKSRNIAAILLGGANVGIVAAGGAKAAAVALPVSSLALLCLAWGVERTKRKELKRSLEQTTHSVDGLLEQINQNYNNSLMTNEIGQALSSSTSTDEILDKVVRILEKRLDYDRGLILLANPEGTKLELQAGYGYGDTFGFFDRPSFHLDRHDSRGIFVTSFRERRPFLVNDLDEIAESLSPRSLAFARKIGSRSFICCPIVREDTPIGILAVDNIRSKRPLVHSDMSLLMGIASVIAVSIRNAELVEGRIRQFNSVIQVLAASIDARDSLTAGHSEKVTEYALGICTEMGFPYSYREMIRVAAMLHDYGKIGVPDAILKKQGRLSEAEYEIVKTHATQTSEILSRIDFEGIYREVPEIAAAHHEKMDGSGYPRGIRGDAIPAGARIIAVADYFEAITAKRHYRDPMPVESAFTLLRAGAGQHFDAEMVEAFIRYYTRTYLNAKSTPASERRRVRVPLRKPAFFRVEGKTSAAVTEDISPRGIFLASEREVGEGMPVEISLPLELPAVAIVQAKGRIAWVNGGDEPKKPEFPAGFGVELLEFRDATGDIFRNFMESCLGADSGATPLFT